MPELKTITVRTASRMPVGQGFQEASVSLSYAVGEGETDLASLVHDAGNDLTAAFAQLWRQLDGTPPDDSKRGSSPK